jgi:multidrug resistance efflux pump
MKKLTSFVKHHASFIAMTVMCLVTLVILIHLWRFYQSSPWTRDARIRVDVVYIAPDVSGLVSDVYVTDNQMVVKGQKLFAIDAARFQLALEDATAKMASDDAILAENLREDKRNVELGNLVAKETVEQSQARTLELKAKLNQSRSNVNIAKLNLTRSVITAPVNGVLTNFDLLAGNYISTGQTAAVLVDQKTLRIEAYFEETKLANITPGDHAHITLMGQEQLLCGHVTSIAAGIEDRERNSSRNQLPNINPTFSWVRLAQRIPVKISLDLVPADIKLIAGRTATVKIFHHATKPDSSC